MNEEKLENIKSEIVKVMKDIYQQGIQDGRSGSYAFEDGFTCEAYSILNEILIDLEEGHLMIVPCKIGDMVQVDTKTLSQKHWHYRLSHRFMKAEVVAIRKTKKQTLIKVKPINPDREWARDYTTYPVSAFGKTVFIIPEADLVKTNESKNTST